MMNSSYKVNNYGEVFRAIVDAFKPHNAVELGCLHGYSTFHIAVAMERNRCGFLNTYDLFEDYPYRHASFDDVVHLFQHYENVKINKADAWTVADKYENRSVDLLHIDLSNTGDIVKRAIEQWDLKMVHGGIILIEGGTVESDNVEWRVKYGASSIKKEIETNRIINERYIYGTYLAYPGLTMLLKKR